MLKDKIIVVTGGAGLLGSEFCRAIAEQGGIAVIADRDQKTAKDLAGKITAAGQRAEPVELDITDAVSVECLIAGLHARYGKIDAVVNNAYPRNKNWGKKLEDVVYEDFCENVNLHLGGYFLVAQKFAKYFSAQGRGNIINMASIYGTVAPRFDIYAETTMTMPVEYAAIKSAVVQLTRYFAQYFKTQGIRCNTLSPGGILDGQAESFVKRYKAHCGNKGMLGTKDLAGALVFLLSDASSHMTGQNLILDDGFSL